MLAEWLRDRLWRADNWCAELAALRRKPGRSPARTFELAVATEHCDPDRSAALGLYHEAARTHHAAAQGRAMRLASLLGAHTTLAELAFNINDLVGAGTAYLDAGFPELAVDPLQKFVDERPLGASVSSEHLRLEQAAPLLAIAQRRKLDAEREIAASLSLATVPAFLHAERVARLMGLQERRTTIINAARVAHPDDAHVAAMVMEQLFERNDADELLAHYREGFERSPSRAAYVERVRMAGIELIARNVQPGLGLRLLRLSLESAYAASLPEITSHLATWHLIWMHAKQQRSTAELAPLIVQAFTAPLPEDDSVYLARLGLEIAWRDVGDPLAAQPYAAVVLDFVPDHPLAVGFLEETIPPDQLERMRPEPDSTPKPPAELPKPPAQLPKTTSRIPTLDEGPVKRSAVASSPMKTTSRVELLRAPARPVARPPTLPPPRAAALKRDTSPIPVAKPPARPIVRAERKVVPIDVVVELATGSFFSTVLRDVSTTGAFVVTKRSLEPGSLLSMELKLPDPGLTQTTYLVQARIVRCTDLGWGVVFIDAARELVAALRAASR